MHMLKCIVGEKQCRASTLLCSKQRPLPFFENFYDSSYFAEAKAEIGNARAFHDRLYFAKDNAMNGRAKTNFGFSRPDLVGSK